VPGPGERDPVAAPVLGPSGLLSPLIKSDCLVMIPLGVEGRFKGAEVRVQLFGGF
jgi:molybdopterin biosynthesis enzyme